MADDNPSTITDMVERVAAHLWNDCKTWPLRHPYESRYWDEILTIAAKEKNPPPGKMGSATILAIMMRRRAKQAIIAIREPTEAMVSAGLEKLCEKEGEQIAKDTDAELVVHIFQAMIDAELKE